MASTTGFANLSSKTPKRASISSAANPIAAIAAVTGKKIRVLAMDLHVSAAGAFIFNSASTELGRYTFTADTLTHQYGYNPDGWFETAVAEAFNITNASTLTTTGVVVYVEI